MRVARAASAAAFPSRVGHLSVWVALFGQKIDVVVQRLVRDQR